MRWSTTDPGRDGNRRPRTAVLLACLLVAGFGLIYGLHWILHPWSLSLPGKPALTGYWQGEIALSPGDIRRFALHLTGDPGRGGCENCSDIDGDAKLCGAGQDMAYEIYGDPQNYRGTRFSLHTRPATEVPGVHLNGLDGDWSGDALQLRAELTLVDPDGVSRSDRQPADPPPFAMRRVGKSTFKATC